MSYFKIILYVFISFSIVGCGCNCTNEEQVFTSEESAWQLPDKVGDTLVFVNASNEERKAIVQINNSYSSNCECGSPGFPVKCCCCPEDDGVFYNYRLSINLATNTVFQINMDKTNSMFNIKFIWNNFKIFNGFDTEIDSLEIQGTTYTQVLKKEVINPDTKLIVYFKKGIGLLRYELEGEVWKRKS